MNNKLRRFPLRAAWRFPLARAVSSRKPVVLVYHSVPSHGDGTFVDSKLFEEHIQFLKNHFEIVSPESLKGERTGRDRNRILLTFDDGFRNHAESVAPILRRHRVPAMFFVCARHATPGRYLWFNYLNALEKRFRGNGFYFRGQFINMSPSQRQASVWGLLELLLNLPPHPAAMYRAIEEELPRLEDFLTVEELRNCYAGMTAEQVGELSNDPLFSVGVHTMDHPFLAKCNADEATRQIQDSKTWIEQACNKECHTIAYPSGDYNAEALRQCRALGISQGYALIPRLNVDPELELPRIGIYATSLDILGFKVQWGNLIRALRINIG